MPFETPTLALPKGRELFFKPPQGGGLEGGLPFKLSFFKEDGGALARLSGRPLNTPSLTLPRGEGIGNLASPLGEVWRGVCT